MPVTNATNIPTDAVGYAEHIASQPVKKTRKPRKPKVPVKPEWMSQAVWDAFNAPVPTVELRSYVVYDQFDNEIIITEEHSDYSTEWRTDSVNGRKLKDPICFAGGYYTRSTIQTLGVVTCTVCKAICSRDHVVDGECAFCNKTIQFISSKTSPPGGWKKFTTGSGNYLDSVMVGIELEIELPLDVEFDHIVRTIPWYLPICYTTDGSLRHGYEINSHMMSVEWIRANNRQLSHMFSELKRIGATHISHNGQETAGMHIHIDNTIFKRDNQDILRDLLEPHKKLCQLMSRRSEERFNHWCWKGPDCGYDYIGKRNNERTWENRGFSSDALLSNPEALPMYVDWCLVLGHISRFPHKYYNKTLSFTLHNLGFTELHDWIESQETMREFLYVVPEPEISANPFTSDNHGRIIHATYNGERVVGVMVYVHSTQNQIQVCGRIGGRFIDRANISKSDVTYMEGVDLVITDVYAYLEKHAELTNESETQQCA